MSEPASPVAPHEHEELRFALEAAEELLAGGPKPHAAESAYQIALEGEALPDLTPSCRIYRSLQSCSFATDAVKALACYRLALCLDRIGNWSASMKSFRAALSFAGQSGYVHDAAKYRLGLLLSAAEEYQEAADLLERTRWVEGHPEVDSRRAELELCRCYLRLQMTSQAARILIDGAAAFESDSSFRSEVRLLRLELGRITGNTLWIKSALKELATVSSCDPQFRAMAAERLLAADLAADLPA